MKESNYLYIFKKQNNDINIKIYNNISNEILTIQWCHEWTVSFIMNKYIYWTVNFTGLVHKSILDVTRLLPPKPQLSMAPSEILQNDFSSANYHLKISFLTW